MISFLIMLLIAAVCGSVGAAIAGVDTRGCLTNMVIGFIGAMLGRWLSMKLDMQDFFYYENIPIIWTIVGSAIFVFLVSVLVGSRKK